MTKHLQAALDRIRSTKAFGKGMPTGEAGDDRRGHFWLITDDRALLAVKIALITGRPLLVEGPSGSGKSALARAVSESLGWTYYETVVTSQTRLDELTGWVDLIQRLHQAEVAGRIDDRGQLPGLDAFVKPGVLWWALDPASAAAAGQTSTPDPGIRARQPAPDDGAVVLIDEIDKAEPDLPNNLLVPLGSWELRIEGRAQPINLARTQRPLVLITSNRERDMPPAFLRRCVVLRLGYPTGDELVEIARRHVRTRNDDLAELVREKLVPEPDHQVSPAEFVDAVRAADGLDLDRNSSHAMWQAVESIVLATARERARG
ncbi:MAG TPA: MoxR family ATPase [Acidimicrobiales bacterium]|nr:MoxR family ATPase [Acidimicrobiales bacterium]